MIRLMIVDDEAAVRESLGLILEGEDDLEVVGEAANAEDALGRIDDVRPDVILMDLRMPGMGGIEGTRRLACHPEPRPKVIALTTFATDDTAVEALRAGAAGFVAKADAPAALFDAIRVVARGEASLSPGMLKSLLDHHSLGPAPSQMIPPGMLTPRELEVLAAIGEGADNDEIARRLYISGPTVHTHVNRLRTKLGATSRAKLVVVAWEMGLVHRT